MKSVEKLLKKEAKKLAPSSNLKSKVENRINGEGSPVYVERHSGGEAVLKNSNKLLIISAILGVALILVIMFSFMAFGKKTYSYITLDVNPSISIVLNSNGEVESVEGINKEGVVITYGESYIGTKEEVVVKLVDEIKKYGYFSTNNEIRLYVDANKEIEEEYYNSLVKAITDYLTQNSINAPIRTANSESIQKGKEKGVSGAKYELANEYANKFGKPVDDALKMPYDELYKKVSNYNENELEIIKQDISKMFNEDFNKNEYKMQKEAYENMKDELEKIEEELFKNEHTAMRLINEYNHKYHMHKDLLIDANRNKEELKIEIENLKRKVERLEEEYEGYENLREEELKRHFLDDNFDA